MRRKHSAPGGAAIKKARWLRCDLWINGLWITLPDQASAYILSKNIRHIKGLRPVDKLIKLLEILHLLMLGFVPFLPATTTFSILAAFRLRFFHVFRFL